MRRFGPESASPVTFAFWQVQPEVVFDNIARFAAETGVAVQATCVGGDYLEAMEDWQKAGRMPDVFYAQRAEAALWDAQGWLAVLDTADPVLQPTLAAMDARLVQGAQREGRLLGLTYYNGGPFALLVHADHLGRLPEQMPTDWAGIVALARVLKRDGVAHPFLPRWHRSQTGLAWSVLCMLASEGCTDLDAPGAEAALTGVVQVLVDLWVGGLVPPESLDDAGDQPFLDRWVSGQHAMGFTMDYLVADAARMAGRPVSLPTARLPGAAGTPLMPGHALLCLRAGMAGAARSNALALVVSLGGIAPDGTPRSHARWLEDSLFAVPIAGLDRAPAMVAAQRRHFPKGHADAAVSRMQTARAAAICSPVTQDAYALAWSAEADRMIRDDLLRHARILPKDAAARLIASWRNRSHR